MSHPDLAIFGYSQAAMFLRGSSQPRLTAIISIHGLREFGVEVPDVPRLDLTFDDAEVPIPGDMMSLQRASARRRWCERNGITEIPPTEQDAAAIIAFAETLRGQRGTLLCHCAAA